MSSNETYAYTLRALIPDLSEAELDTVAEKILNDSNLVKRNVISAVSENRITLTISERTVDPVAHFPDVLYLAKLGLSELGIKKPMFIDASVIPEENTTQINAHINVVMEQVELARIDLTDDLLRDELNS